VHVPGRHGRNPQTGNIDVAGERNCKRGVARPGNVLHLAGNVEALPHPAMFPVELPAFFIVVFTEPDDVVLDPFLGAGSTIVAAEQERRQGLGIEVHPESVAVTLERLADLGLQPLRVVEGEADGGGADAAGGGTSGVF
jgi:hypothetical protein